MIDKFGRDITYLRISVTELCNLRCRYCMPEEGICKKSHSQMLTEDEIIDVVKAAASLGINKVRITGGEPLVKKNIVSICRRVAQVEGIREVCMTTNGLLLPELAGTLREAGVSRLNLSLDTLNEEKYRYITRKGELSEFRKGLEAALEAGFEKIKINTVLIGGFNEDEIVTLADLTRQYPVDVRFIEMMPMYDSGDFEKSSFISAQKVLEQLPEAVPEAISEAVPKAMPEAVPQMENNGVAVLYRLPGAQGNVGLITPVSSRFCSSCNRLRLTADGKLKPCLHCGDEISLKGHSIEEMTEIMKNVIWNKPPRRGDLDVLHRSQAGREMNQIGG